MNVTLLVLHGSTDSNAEHIVAEAAQLVFPDVTVRDVASVQEALDTTSEALQQILVLFNPSSSEVEAAMAATDAAGLPRWAVMILGSGDSTMALPREEWNQGSIARAFRYALVQHANRRDMAAARGDLKTIGHRWTHDLRAHLGGVLSAAEALQETLDDARSPMALCLDPILKSTEAIAGLLERISFVTRASAAPSRLEPLDMGMAFWAALQHLELAITQKQATLIQPDRWPRVVGVTSWLEVVWWNLLANALQHGSPRPRITAGWEPAETECRFWLKDDGRGVPKGKRAALFHPLNRLHETNAPAGIGLSIVGRLVQLQGGRCGYEPPEEGDCCFYFILPNPAPAEHTDRDGQ